ncbi:MAG TPA: prepilin-type N-terminal cleavage/methylation domain-containing protein [Gemmatimonadales bacterium]|jgi:prepilin-type N-terminal cleavage/methylation domain-containing protein|nr:prepilin-type N-terminal cleavage/methylation domain-containing protein [Gemmatimonadales bacterium]
MRTSRAAAGFSLIEMLIVVVVIGLVTLFAFPRAGLILDRTAVSGARTALVNQFGAARLAARSSNRATVFRLSGNVVWVERRAFSGTVKQQVGNRANLMAEYGTTVSGPDSIVVDPRGIAVLYSSGNSALYTVTRNTITNTVTINSSGRVVR